LGTAPDCLFGDRQLLYACGEDGILRAASPSEPDHLRWECPLGGRVDHGPAAVTGLLLVVIGGELVAVER
jgi:hypothetical protein